MLFLLVWRLGTIQIIREILGRGRGLQSATWTFKNSDFNAFGSNQTCFTSLEQDKTSTDTLFIFISNSFYCQSRKSKKSINNCYGLFEWPLKCNVEELTFIFMFFSIFLRLRFFNESCNVIQFFTSRNSV